MSKDCQTHVTLNVMVLVDRIFILLAIVFSVLGVINGARHQFLAIISIITCAFLTLYFQGHIIDFITQHISQEPIINFLILCAVFFLLYFVLKHLILTITYSNKGNNKSSFLGHILGAIFGVINCWLLAFTLITIAANHSQTRTTANEILGASTFLSLPFDFSKSIKSWRASKDLSKKLTKTEPIREEDHEK